ncbi:MAG: alkaline phosphatase D family protein [Candidatus Kapaibacterium sp.]
MVRTLLCLLVLACTAHAQGLLQSGPMVGYSDMRETKLWVQTTTSASVHFVYWDSAAPAKRYSTTDTRTIRQEACTAHCTADSVLPGKTYMYELYINDKRIERPYPLKFKTPPLWQWRTDPPTMRIALGSCAYVNEERFDRAGKAYGGDEQIFTHIAKQQPDIMLWLGDNVYMREPDWNTRTGIYHRYTHTRSLPQMQPLLAACANYAIWDDHDYGPNDCDRGFWNKEETYNAFKMFWANPRYGMADANGGITSMFQWGDVDVFLVDDRWFRSPDKRKTGERTILGKQQFEWLIDNLASSTATFKLVCIGGQVLNSVAQFENYATYPEERKALIETIQKERISGVMFLSGDRHHTELSVLRDSTTVPLYDFTVSPLTAGTNPNAATEANTYRVDGTFVGEHNFATIDVTGIRGARELTLTVFDANGKQKWQKKITAAEMKKQ